MRCLILALFLLLGTSSWSRADGLLGQAMLHAGRAALARTATTAGLNLAEEMPLQAARGEKPSGDRAVNALLDGTMLVEAAGWVAGHGLVAALLGPAAPLARPFLSAAAANLGAEFLSYGAVAAWQHKKIDPLDLVGRSVFGAIGGAAGTVFLPGIGPVLGYLAGVTVGDVLWEHALKRLRPRTGTVSKPVEWFAGEAPPLGPYRAPRVRGVPLLAPAPALP